MADATAEFFDGLADRGLEPVLGRMTATIRVEVTDGRHTDRWLVAVTGGVIEVRPGDGEADCVIRATRQAFDAVASGRTNAMAAALRGALELEGEVRHVVRFQRLFPAPTGMPASAGARSVGRRRS